jgi:phosphate transport system substrate-binding protein
MALAVAAALSLAGCAGNENANDDPATLPSAADIDTDASQARADSADDDVPPEPDAGLSGTLNGGGATSQSAAQEAWRAGFASLNPAVTVNYDPTGSGDGRKAFQEGGLAFAGSDGAFDVDDISAGEFNACADGSGLVEVPVYISPIAVAFNLSGIDSLNLDAATIAAIFTGQITAWDDAAIVDQNDGVDLPDLRITPVHRSDGSGTTANFTDYLDQTSGGAWTDGKVEDWPESLEGEAAEGTSGVAETITATEGAIGYLDASRAGTLGTAAIQVGDAYVSYSPAAATAAAGVSTFQEGRAATDVVVDINRTVNDGEVYPLILISYLIGCETYGDPAQGSLAKAFFDYAISPEGQTEAAKNAGSAPITGDPNLEPRVSAAVAAIRENSDRRPWGSSWKTARAWGGRPNPP